jgi:hypothetical protein
MIEKDTRLKKGIGIGYTPPDKPCSVFCLHVPEGSQLLIGVADLEHQLSLYVLDILFENWDPGLPPNIGMLAGTNRIIVVMSALAEIQESIGIMGMREIHYTSLIQPTSHSIMNSRPDMNTND